MKDVAKEAVPAVPNVYKRAGMRAAENPHPETLDATAEDMAADAVFARKGAVRHRTNPSHAGTRIAKLLMGNSVENRTEMV